MSAFDWGTFFTSISTAVVVAVLVDYGKNTTKRLIDYLKGLVVKLLRKLKAWMH